MEKIMQDFCSGEFANGNGTGIMTLIGMRMHKNI